ncbi:heme oxygenase-like [Daphnia pulex]|uniref:heme oxygenase-like n=1 Tax=Daphnia pulex TaxID=6669 RepID=UPI001EE0665D|nr:heme oxygenase-like [Daphnia pulex]
MAVEGKLEFTKQMRKATREIHDISDALVNAKLGIAMSDNSIWAEGLLCFYEIFKYLEEALDRLNHTLLSELDIKGMRRTKAFEEDLHFYYGRQWFENDYQPSTAVTAYIDYLTSIERDNPNMLAAYIYHLFMGLFSGGQILRKKRSLEASLKFQTPPANNSNQQGESVTDFGEIPIFKLKKQMVDAMEHIAEQLGEEDRWKLIEESKNVFRMNNKVIRTINTNKIVLKKFCNFALIVVPAAAAIYFGYKMISNINNNQ